MVPLLLGATVLISATTVQAASEPIKKVSESNLEASRTDSLLIAQAASTMPQIEAYALEKESETADQVTSVSQLTDVKPTDWASQALQSLVERYGCIVGYPDKTFRGNRVLTRYEFAAGLNACMDRINELIGASTADLIKKEDLLTIQRLQESFAAELAALRGRIDALEVRTATLEQQQFSTTTKLLGVATMYVAGAAGSETATSYVPTVNGVQVVRPGEDIKKQAVMQYSTLLSLNTSFSGSDNLSVDLWTSNLTPFSSPIFGVTKNVTGTYQTRLSFDAPPYDSKVTLADLIYKFQPVNNLTVFIDAVGGEVSGELLFATQPFTVFAPYTTSISRFGRYDPIYYQTLARPGVAASYKFSDKFSVGAGYYADFFVNNPQTGLFDGGNAAIVQLSLFPTDTLGMTLVYVRSYNPAGTGVSVSGQTGSLYADQPFGTTLLPNGAPASIATTADHLSWGFGWRPISQLAFTGDVGVAFAHAQEDNPAYGVSRGDGATLFEWNFAIALPDLFKKGNVGSLMVGNPYRVVSQGSGTLKPESDTAWHIEAAYKHNINNNLSLQPGFLVILNPENNNNNPTIWVWQLKTQFMF